MNNGAEYWRGVISGDRGGLTPFLLRRFLWTARGPYSLGVWWRNRGYDRGRNTVRRVPVPVISVGNLTVGGTGKTPCVEWIARFYRERDQQVAILSRGYGSESGRNDEAMMLEANLPDVPHLQGADRAELAQTAVEELESEILILDDGFQHRKLHRDLDLVLIDASEPKSHHYLFPRGTLREPWSGLKRADAVILTHCDRVNDARLAEIEAIIRRQQPEIFCYHTKHDPVELVSADEKRERLEAVRGRTVAAFCGIGNPVSFRRTLQELGADVKDFRTFADHHPYTREDVASLKAWAGKLPEDAMVLTTQKDWVKLRIGELAGHPLWAVRIGLSFLEGAEQGRFEEMLWEVSAFSE